MDRDRGQCRGEVGRREFIRTTAQLGAGMLAAQAILSGGSASAQSSGSQKNSSPDANASSSSSGIPMREFGKTGIKVSALGLGGYHIGISKDEAEAIRLIQEAVDNGVTFMDNAWDYHMGGSEERMGKALKGRRDKVFLMTKVCTHGRNAEVGMKQL